MRPKEFASLLADNINTVFWPAHLKVETHEKGNIITIRVRWGRLRKDITLSRREIKLNRDPWGMALETAKQVYADFVRGR